ACGDHGSACKEYTVKNGCVRANPNIIPDNNAVAIAALFCNEPLRIAIVQIVRDDDHVRGNLHMAPNGDVSVAIQNCERMNCNSISKDNSAAIAIKARELMDGTMAADLHRTIAWFDAC